MTTALVKKQTSIRDLLVSRKESIASILPAHMKHHAERMIKVVMIAINRQPKLVDCTQVSLLESVMSSAELGLDCGGVLGQAYLVPYGQQCQLIIGYRGLVELARRSGKIASIEAHAVYDDEVFDLVYTATGPMLKHEPKLDGPKEEKNFRGAYVITRMADEHAEPEIVWMNVEEINAIRRRSKASASGPWKTDYVEMAKKTVVRRAAKMWPLSPELHRAFEIDSTSYTSPIDLAPGTEPIDPPAPVPVSSFGFGASGDRPATASTDDTGAATSSSPVDSRLTALVSLVSTRAGILNQSQAADMLKGWLKKKKIPLSKLADDEVYAALRVEVVDEETWIPV